MTDIRDIQKAADIVNKYKASAANNNAPGNVSNNTNSNKSAYQANLSQPTQTQPKNFSTRFIVGQIATLGQSDPSMAKQYYQKLQYSMADPNSHYYNPYNQPTNRAVSNLAALGFDTNNLNDDWFNANQGWISSNLSYTGTTNSPSKPGKKATRDQNIAYELYQWHKSEDTTKKAEQEWQALQDELTWMAKDNGRNYSDDKIMELVYGEDGEKLKDKYPTLFAMGRDKYIQPTELNRGIEYSKDAMYGVLWAARNPEYQGNIWGAMANSALGTGNQYVEDPEITAKLNWSDKSTYAPYSVGSTLVKEGKYFGCYNFGKDEINNLKNGRNPVTGEPLDPNDETSNKMVDSVLKAEDRTVKAEQELAGLNEEINKWIGLGVSENIILNKIDSLLDKCPTLLDMDKSLEGSPDALLGLTRAVDYKKTDFINDVKERIADRDGKGSGVEYTNAMLGDPRFTAPAAAENTVPENRSVSPAGTSPVGTSAQLSENESGIEGWANYSATNTGPDGKPLKTPTDLIPGTQAGANNEPVALTSQDIETIKAKDAMVANALPAIEGDLTESEQALLTNGGSTAWDYMKNVFSYIRSNVDRVRGLAQDSYDASMKSYIEDNLDAAFAVGKYNVISDNLSADQDKLLEYQRKYGDLENYYSEVKDSEDLFDPELDAQFYFEFNRETNRYEVNGIVDQVDGNGYSAERTYGEGTRGAELVAKANALAEEKTKKARQILTAQIVMNTPEGKAEIEAYGALAAQVEEEKKYVKENDLAYEEKNTSMQNARAKAGKAFSVGRVLGVGNSDDLAKADAIVEYLSNYYNQPQLPASGVTPLQAISRSFEIYGKTATREEMSGSIHQSIDMIDQAIALDEELLAYVDEQGIKIPDVVRRNLQFELEDYRNERQAFAYSSILTDTDPEELEKAIIAGLEFEEKYGKEMEAWDEIFSDETTKDDQYKTLGGKLRFMEADFVDDDDKKIYYYLLGQSVLANGAELEAAIEANDTYGIRDILDEKILKTSNDFVSFMDDDDYGVWTSREKEQLQESAKEMVDSGFWGGALANIGATLSTPLESILSGVYMLDKAVSGERINPDTRYRLPSVFKESTRAETRKSIQDTFGEGTFESWLANLGYEIYCNRGDSLMNQLTFGPLLGGSGMRGEFTGSMPMGASAALNAAAEAVENGANVDQAWLIAGATFIAETATEAITYSNIRDALGTAEELTTETLTGFVREWLLKSGLEEVGGEVTNNIVERLASEIAARMEDGNYQSDHDRLVEQYIAQGKLPDEAEQLARLDEFKEDVHTAIVSYLSAGTDVFVQTGKAAANTFNYYRSATRNAQQNYGDSRSMLRHMLDDYKVSKYIQSTPPTPANGTVRMQDTEQTQNAPAEEQTQQTQETQVQEAQASPAAEQTQEAPVSSENLGTEVAPNVFVSEEMDFSDLEKEYAQDIETLDSAIQSADSSAISAGIASVIGFDASDAGSDQANAAAIRAVNLFKNGADDVSDILYGGFLSKVDAVALKSGIQFAALGGENSECYNLTQTEQFMNATPEQKALMLAQASVSDARNTAVQQNVAGLVKENRLAEAAKTVIANGSMAGTMKAQEAVNDAQTKNRQAKADLETRQAETQAASDNREAADKLAIEDPLNEKNEKAAEQARQKLTSTIAVEQEYEQHAENAQRDQEKAEANLETVKQQEITNTRQQSDQIVAEVDQQRADQAAQIAEQQRIAEEQAAQAQAEQDRLSGKEAEERTRVAAEDWANQMHLEGEERDSFIQRVVDRQEQLSLGKIDMTGKVNNTEGFLAISALSRKTGMPFKLSDTLPDGVRGAYEDGTVYLNANLIRSGNMTIGQALVEAALHESTHGMEKTGYYRKYQDTVLNILYGKGSDRNNQQLEADIKEKMDLYSGLKTLDREGAIKEIVADFARLKMADKEIVSRFMDAGMGGRMRNSLHNINQGLKNFFGNMTGEERAKAEDFRKAERLYQKALNQVARAAVHPSGGQFSVSQFAQAAGMNFDEASQTLIDNEGNIVDGVTNKISPDMVTAMPVGRLIDAGIRQGTISQEKAAVMQEQFAGLLNMCAQYRDSDMIWEIAASTLESQFSAIKSNSDKQYSTTVDFGTICAKTQAIVDQLSRNMLTLGRGLTIKEILDVYNDVYGAGLSVPCPVCYVFSRWMGVPSLLNSMKDYQDRFLGKQGEEVSLEETQRRVDEYVKEAQKEYGIDETYGERVAKAKQDIQEKMDKVSATISTLEENVAKKQAVLDARRAAGKTTANAQKQLASAENKLNAAREKLSDLQTQYDNVETESYGKAINKAKTKLDSDYKSVMDKIDGGDTGNGLNQKIANAKREGKDTSKMEAEREALWAKADEINAERAKVDGYNWVTQSLCYLDENGRFVVDTENFERTPDEILFDLNRTAEFSKYAKNWKYRCTRGAGMGKAILPYSGASLGDSVYGTGARSANNALLAQDYDQDAIDKGLESAMKKARAQNLIGGQRFQSTSDYRPEWGLDYIMTFIEQQAIGSCGQLYTKVAEAVPLFAKAGIDTNLSVMPYGDGYHIDENGQVVLDFSDVTGMDVDTAIELKNQYPNVQLILVGINDTHILAALKDADIDFVIPWHSSGNSRDQLSSMMSSVKEQLNESSDYTKLQSDAKYEGEAALVASAKEKIENGEELTTAEANAMRRENNRNVRTKILTGKFANTQPTASEMKTISGSQYLQSLYDRFYVDETSDCYGVTLTSSQASQIFPYEYWQMDVTKPGGTKKTADENGRRFCEYCSELGYVPRFSGRDVEITNEDKTKTKVNYGNFSGMQIDENGNMTFNPVEGYWKLLIDRSMYDLEGNYRSQQKIDVTNVNVGEIQVNEETGKKSVVGSDLNREDVAKMQKNRPKYRLDNADIINAHRDASKAFDQRMKISTPAYNTNYQFSAYGDMTDADIDQVLTQANQDYMNAARNGDLETAQEAVDYAADQAGYRITTYHGTGEDFTVFKRGWEGIHLGNLEQASQVADTRYEQRSKTTDYRWGKIKESIAQMTPEQRESLVKNAYLLADYISDSEGIYPFNGDITNDEEVRTYAESIVNKYAQEQSELDGFTTDPEDINIRMDTFDRNVGRKVMKLYAKINNPFLINGDINSWTPWNIADVVLKNADGITTKDVYGTAVDITGSNVSLTAEQRSALEEIASDTSPTDETWDALSDVLNELGFDGIQYLNTYEGDKNSYSYIALKQSDIKLADPITYDDNGEIIPLNERFNQQNNDIRYSVGGEMTDADIDRMLESKGVVPEGEWTGGSVSGMLAGNVNYSAKDGYIKFENAPSEQVIDNLKTIGMIYDPAKREWKDNGPRRLSRDTIVKAVEDGNNGIAATVPQKTETRQQKQQNKTETAEPQIDEERRAQLREQLKGKELNQMYVDAGIITPEELAEYQANKASNPLEGQNPTMSTAQGTKVRAFAAENGMLQSADQLNRFAKAVATAQNTYFPDTNEDQVIRAVKWIRSLRQTENSDGYAEAVNAIARNDFDYRSADGQARMVAVMGLANAKNDILGQAALADAFMRQGTDLGRALQARKLFKLMTPEGRVSTLMKTLNEYNTDLKSKGMEGNLKFSDWVLRAAASAETAEDFRKVQIAAAEELAAKLPISWKERLNSLRMLSMLGNPRTHIRNLVGNALFVPAVGMKNKMGALLELGVKKGERTKTLAPVLNNEIREFARQDARSIKDTLTGEAKYDEHGLVEKAKNPLGPALGKLSDANSWALEAEDWLFLRGHYRKALGGWMQANGYTVDQVKNNKALLEKGRQYAITEAQKATYRDFNGLAQKLNQMTRNAETPGQKALAFGVNAVLPFRKTPANILKRGIEYSPLGVARSVYNLGRHFINGDVSSTEVIDQFTSGLTGTAIMAIGYLLAGTGAVSCGFDDDDWAEELKGKQKYSVNFGKAGNELLGMFGIPKLFGEDVTYTMDWAAPMSLPFFVGASIRDQADNDGWDVEKVLSAMGSISEPIFNLSMLDGVNSILKVSSYTNENPVTQIAGKVVSNYASSYVPSVIGAITRTWADDTQRKSFVTKGQNNGLEGTFRYAWESVENKLPGVSKTNIPVRDVWGKAKTSEFAERIIENFISPGYIEHYEDDPVVNELGRLFDRTGSPKLEPEHAATSIKDKSVGTWNLGPEEYDKFDQIHGETQYSMLKEIVNSKEYQDITDDDVKVEIIDKVYSYANSVAKAAMLPDYKYDKQTAADFVHEGKVTDYKAKMLQCLDDKNYEGFGNYVEALREEGVEDNAIKDKISGKYRDAWKEAYRGLIEADTDAKRQKYSKQMMDIEEILLYTGFDFNINGKNGWESQVDKEYLEKGSSSGGGGGRPTAIPERPASDNDWGRYMDELDNYWASYDFDRNDPTEQNYNGTIDINNRQVVHNEDGSISTEYSFSFWDDDVGKEVLIPQVVNGRIVSEQEAKDHYYETGEHLGMFDDWHDADEYSMMLHNRNNWKYNR